MKKVFTLISLMCFFKSVFPQACTPDPQYAGNPGIYPDTITNLPIAYIGQAYSEVMTFVMPSDTTVNQPPLGTISLTINYYKIDSVSYEVSPGNFSGTLQDINFDYACEPSLDSCYFPGGTSSCLIITGNPQLSDTGTYTLVLYVTANVTHALLGTFNAPQSTIKGYELILNSNSNTPSANFATSSTTICTGSTVNFTNQSTNATSYLWSFPGGSPNSSTQPNPFVTYNSSGTYTATLTAYNGSNTDVQSVTINVSSSPTASVSYSGSTTICQGQSLTLTANNGNGYSYQWQNNGVNINNATSSSYNAGSNGSYSVVITNSCGSTVSQAVTVSVSNSQTATVNPSGTVTFCQGQSVVLSANTGNGFSYQWQNNNANIGGATSSTYTVSAAGNYTVIITSSCGTATSQSVAVSVTQSQTATISAGSSTTFCVGQSVLLTANTGTSGLTYQWQQNGFNISNATNSTYTVITGGSYTVVVTSSCGSAVSQPTSVTVNPLPTVSINPGGPTTFCDGGYVQLVANTNGVISYQWQLNNGNITGATTSVYTATQNGNYSVIVVNGSGCTANITQNVTVQSSNINPSFTSNQQLFTAPPFAVQFTNTTPNFANYNFTWDFGDGSTSNSNNSVVFHEYQYNGLYDVQLLASDQNVNCEDSVVYNDYIFSTGGTDNPNGIDETSLSSISILPNPASTLLTLQTQIIAKLDYTIFDITGRQLQTGSFTQKKNIDVSSFAEGVYVIQLQTEQGLVSRKFVKQ